MIRAFTTGSSLIYADEKNLRAPNPADPTTDIWYCCPEGPEAGMYIRGTATLANGRGQIDLHEHFRKLASESGMTVQFTPRSIDSQGLAVIERLTAMTLIQNHLQTGPEQITLTIPPPKVIGRVQREPNS